MSAKGDKIRSKFVQQTGAMDAITKPFDARGLIAVVEGALKRYEEGRIRPLPDPSKLPDEYMSGDSYRPSPSQRSDPALSRVWAAREIGLHIARLVTPELAKIPSLSRSELDSLPQVFTRMLTPEVLSSLNLVLRAALPPEKDREVLSGDISVISIAEVLQLLNLQRQTGALAIYSRHNREVTLYVRDGNIDLASWRGLRDEFFVGRYLIEQGVVTREMLAGALEQALDRKQLLGEALVELGVIRAEHVRQALIRQTSELVYEVVRWTNGRFRFASGTRLPAAERAELGLPVGGLVMEGFRRVDEWRLIEGSFHFD
jgi:hypothetical protein